MLGTGLATINIISDLGIYSRLVDSSLGGVSHLLNSSVVAMQDIEHLSYSSDGIHTLFPFSSIPFSTANSSWVPQKWCAILGTSWILLGQPFKVNLYMVLQIGSLSTAPLTMFNLSGSKCML